MIRLYAGMPMDILLLTGCGMGSIYPVKRGQENRLEVLSIRDDPEQPRCGVVQTARTGADLYSTVDSPTTFIFYTRGGAGRIFMIKKK